MADSIDIDAEAAKAKGHELDGEKLERRSIDDLIKAKRFNQQQDAANGDNFGPLFQTFQPPGTV